jgi:hypothetical protein
MVFSNNLLMGAGGQATGYEIDQSIRFNNDDSPVMSRSFGTPTDRNKFTYAFWIKSTSQSGGYNLGINVTGGVTFAGMIFNGNNMSFFDYTSGSASIDVRSTFTSDVGRFQDYSAWYHAVFAYDSDQGTAANRLKFYINGVQFPSASLVGPSGGSAVFPSSGFDSKFNASGTTHTISDNVNGKIDGYMAEIYFIDGQALDATSFGEFNPSGVFVPIEYSGAFGDNGFFIDGRDSSDLGDDESGNGNDFSTSGLAAADQMPDSPTNNYCILNFLNKDTDCTLSNGNLQVGWTSGTDPIICGTMGVSSGKWYYEGTFTGTFNFPAVGIAPAELSFGASAFDSGNGALFYYAPSGNYRGNGDNVSYGAEYFVTSKIGVALNLDDDEITFYKDNASQGTLNLASIRSGYSTWVPLVTGGGSVENIIVNFGQSDFEYTPPTGFKAWNTSNLPTPTISDGSKYFQTALYTATTGAQDITFGGNSDLAPDWLWFKARSAASDHFLFDKVRGALKTISSNDNTAEESSTGSMTAFGTDGFSLGDGGSNNDINGVSGTTYAAWGWSAGNSTGSSNTDGDITSTVTANTTSGFSVLTYTGNGSDNQEIGHGIGIAPKMIFSKRTNTTGNWTMYHDAVGINKVMYLNLTSLPASNTEQYRATPSSSVYTVGVGGDINASGGSYVAYCFAEVEGYSKMGSYVANASTNGPFVYCGFLPAFVIFFSIAGSGAGRWMLDGTRSSFNAVNKIFQANTVADEDSGTSYELDFVSNGFKIRTASDFNASGRTIAYAAFAKHPFGGDSTAPVTGGFLSS